MTTIEKAQEVFFSLPLPPSINSYWGYKGSRRFIAAEGKQFKQEVALIVKSQPHRFGDKKIAMAVEIHFRDKRRQDISNRIKALEDALVSAGLFDDDSQIDLLIVRRGGLIKQGRCDVTLSTFSGMSLAPLETQPEPPVPPESPPAIS